jgi:CTP:molybdopterin cytidylyltransferase MocA
MAAKFAASFAAGASKRFGSDKLLHPLAGGTPVAVAAPRQPALGPST